MIPFTEFRMHYSAMLSVMYLVAYYLEKKYLK
jgi:hypothetical protein